MGSAAASGWLRGSAPGASRPGVTSRSRGTHDRTRVHSMAWPSGRRKDECRAEIRLHKGLLPDLLDGLPAPQWTPASGGPLPYPRDAGRQMSRPILPSAFTSVWNTRSLRQKATDSVDYDNHTFRPAQQVRAALTDQAPDYSPEVESVDAEGRLTLSIHELARTWRTASGDRVSEAQRPSDWRTFFRASTFRASTS